VFPVYALVVAEGGAKLTDLTNPGEKKDAKAPFEMSSSSSASAASANYGDGTSASLVNNIFQAKKLTIARLASTLLTGLDLPVVDMTGLTGKYDFSIVLSEEDYRGLRAQTALNAGVAISPENLQAVSAADNSTLYAGLRDLGLKLELRKMPMPVLIVDSILKSPTEN
jgi:uncharacterized protein (TIGR03435 family)